MHRAVHALVAALVLVACDGSDGARSPLLHPPFLGLACRTDYPCEQVAIAVFVPDDTRRVTARVRGRSVVLRKPDRPGTEERPRAWKAFVRLPGAQELAVRTRRVKVRIRVVAADGSTSEASAPVPIALGRG